MTISAKKERVFEKKHIEKQRDIYLKTNAVDRYNNDIGYREKINIDANKFVKYLQIISKLKRILQYHGDNEVADLYSILKNNNAINILYFIIKRVLLRRNVWKDLAYQSLSIWP